MKIRRLDFLLLYPVTLALLVVVLAPVIMVVLGAFLNTKLLGISSEQWVVGSSDAIFTTQWFAYVWTLYLPQALFSLKLAGLCVLICLLIAVPGGYALARRAFPGSGLVEEIMMLPLALPGIAMSIALLATYAAFRGEWGLVLCGHLLYTIPFMGRAVINTLRSADIASQERAAQSLGAGFVQRFFLIVLPGLRHAMIVGSLLVFAISWGEFNVSYLLTTPLNQTVPAALYATYTFNSYQVSSAATTLFLAVIFPVLIAVQIIGGKESIQPAQGA